MELGLIASLGVTGVSITLSSILGIKLASARVNERDYCDAFHEERRLNGKLHGELFSKTVELAELRQFRQRIVDGARKASEAAAAKRTAKAKAK